MPYSQIVTFCNTCYLFDVRNIRKYIAYLIVAKPIDAVIKISNIGLTNCQLLLVCCENMSGKNNIFSI